MNSAKSSALSLLLKTILTCLLLTGFGFYRASAQTDRSVSLPQLLTGKKKVTDTLQRDTVLNGQKDLPDVFKALFHLKPSKENDSIGSKPIISIVPALGYTLVSKLAIVLSGNLAFRTGPKSRVSTVVGSVSYTQNKQIIVPIQTAFWTKKNDYVFVGDYRFYQYPQSTFGLGSSSSIKDEEPMDFSFARFYETALRHISGNWYAGLGYAIDAYWNITQETPLDGQPSAYLRYGKSSRSVASGFTFNILHDSRDNSINPSKGWYGSLQYRNSNKWMGSTANWRSLIVDLRKYINFPYGSKNVLAFWSYNWVVLNGRPSYLNLPSSSWDANSATGRGYIQGRFRGAQMFYLESEYRFNLTQNGLIGGVLFANAQTLSAEPGTRLQRIQPAIGPGLRLKLNKTSRTNIAIDYGFGRQGSRGLFIDVGEVF